MILSAAAKASRQRVGYRLQAPKFRGQVSPIITNTRMFPIFPKTSPKRHLEESLESLIQNAAQQARRERLTDLLPEEDPNNRKYELGTSKTSLSFMDQIRIMPAVPRKQSEPFTGCVNHCHVLTYESSLYAWAQIISTSPTPNAKTFQTLPHRTQWPGSCHSKERSGQIKQQTTKEIADGTEGTETEKDDNRHGKKRGRYNRDWNSDRLRAYEVGFVARMLCSKRAGTCLS